MLLLSSVILTATPTVGHAQVTANDAAAAPISRSEVKMDRNQFVGMQHEESTDVWALKRGFAQPEDVPDHELARQHPGLEAYDQLR